MILSVQRVKATTSPFGVRPQAYGVGALTSNAGRAVRVVNTARADITSGIENVYGVGLGDNIYEFRITDSTIILLEKAVTSDGEGFVESEHVK